VAVALVLAQPDLGAVLSGEIADPIGETFAAVFGTVGSKVITVVILISFLSATLSLQAAASRLLYSYARDRMVVGSQVLARFSERRHVPPNAMIAATVLPAAIVVIAQLVSEEALLKVISFAAAGIYLAFQAVVLGALIARARGWRPSGKFTLGRWGMAVNVAALIYGIAAAINLVWPRGEGLPWTDRYIVLLGCAVVVATGVLYMVLGRPYRHSDAPEADAVRSSADSREPALAGAGGSGRRTR
jgi:amino acid transporter